MRSTTAHQLVEAVRRQARFIGAVVARIAAHDVALRHQHGDAALAFETHGVERHFQIVVHGDTVRFAAMQLVFQLAPHLVFVLERIDQPGLLRLCGRERALVDDGAHVGGGLLAAGGDVFHQVAVKIVHQAADHFMRLGAHVRACEHVAEVFVLAGVLHLHIDAELIEALLEIHQLRAQSFEHELVRLSEVDAVGRRRQVVLARSGRAQVGVDGLAGFAEEFQVGAQLLKLGPAAGEVLRQQHDGLDVAIRRGFLQGHPDARHGDPRPVASQ